MSKSRPTPSRRPTCIDVRFVEVDFPRQRRPRLVIEFNEGLSLLLEDHAANCRAQDLDPEVYLVEVIRHLPHDATPEQAAALTPGRIAAERRAAAAEAA